MKKQNLTGAKTGTVKARQLGVKKRNIISIYRDWSISLEHAPFSMAWGTLQQINIAENGDRWLNMMLFHRKMLHPRFRYFKYQVSPMKMPWKCHEHAMKVSWKSPKKAVGWVWTSGFSAHAWKVAMPVNSPRPPDRHNSWWDFFFSRSEKNMFTQYLWMSKFLDNLWLFLSILSIVDDGKKHIL